jgi:hypothetical protein
MAEDAERSRRETNKKRTKELVKRQAKNRIWIKVKKKGKKLLR